jgi:hypothetical protein
VDVARELFIDVVVIPALAVEGLDRLRALCASFLSYVDNRTLPGGCFFAAAAAELGGRPGPLKDRVAANQRDWIRVLTEAADEAVRRGSYAPTPMWSSSYSSAMLSWPPRTRLSSFTTTRASSPEPRAAVERVLAVAIHA